MTPLRLSATTIEQYRRVVETEYAREGELIESIRGRPFPKSWQMRAGKAWHAILERPLGPLRAFESEDGFHFPIEAVRSAKGLVGDGGRWEVKATRAANVRGREIRIVAKVDHVSGLIVSENKAKFSYPDVKAYDADLQWRAYLWCHGAERVVYRLFCFRDPQAGICELTNVLQFSYAPYADLEADLLDWAGRLVDWAVDRRLLGDLERAGTSPNLE